MRKISFIKYPLALISCLIGFVCLINAQPTDPNPREDYLNQNLQTREFDKAQWEALTADLDYSDQPPDKEKKEKSEKKPNTPPHDNSVEFLSSFFKIVVIILAIAIMMVLLLHFMNGNNLFSPKNRKIHTRSTNITLENIEENIHESDLEGFIRQATEQEDYALAIRLYYLAILKELSLEKLINWKKDKTNGDYLKEMRGHPYFLVFEETTLIFEKIWYGKMPINAKIFAEIRPQFQQLITSISNIKQS